MPMPLLKFSALNAHVDWGGLVRIPVIQVAVLLAILAATIQYFSWTSDAAQAEFMSAGKSTVLVPQTRQLENSSKLRCDLRKLLYLRNTKVPIRLVPA